MPLIFLFFIMPGSIPIFFIVTFILGISDKNLPVSDTIKKFSGYNIGKLINTKIKTFLKR